MKARKALTGLHMILVLIIAISSVLTACTDRSGDQNTVFEDMEAAFQRSNLQSSNIGLFSKTATGDSISYGECGSGVIIEKRGEVYYALTAAHVVSAKNAQVLVFTVNTEMKTDQIPGIQYNVLSREVYESMYTANVEYVSSRDDLAVIREIAQKRNFRLDKVMGASMKIKSQPNVGTTVTIMVPKNKEWRNK